MRIIWLIWLAVMPAFAGDLLLGARGETAHTIVIPAAVGDKAIDSSLQQAGALLQEAFQAQGIEIPVVTEGEADVTPGIYVGKTAFAEANGIDVSAFEGWTYRWQAVGDSVVIIGNDQPDPMPAEKRRARELRQGGIPLLATYKGVTEFAYRFLGARFLTRRHTTFIDTPNLSVPDDLNETRRPWARNLEVSRESPPWGIANGFEPVPLALSNYGHYHQTAVPHEVYGETNPEYFIWGGGKRNPETEHLCFSNPEVRELIYQKILADADTGYTMIEIGQIDGFRPCSCQPCYDLYDIHPTHSPEDGSLYLGDAAFGNKLWIMHRDMALRLMKDRPGVQLLLSAYSVTRQPPTAVTSFPPNVTIQLMGPKQDLIDAWSKLDVPGGFTAYTYLWSRGSMAGYTPNRSAQYMREHTDRLVAADLNIIQNNGKPYTYGIEAINIYSYPRFMNDPHGKTMQELNREYIEAAYREAAGPMHSFYRKLHQRLTFAVETGVYAYQLNRNPLLYYSTLYTPELLNALDSHLTAAEGMAQHPFTKEMLAAVRMEFTHLWHMVRVIHYYHAFLLEQDEASHEDALKAVEDRNAWLASIVDPTDKRVPRDAPLYRYQSLATLKANGKQYNIAPFNWDVDARRAPGFLDQAKEDKSLDVRRAQQPVTMDAEFWQELPKHELSSSRKNRGPLTQPTTFQVAYDESAIYFRVAASMKPEDMTDFTARGRDAEIWLQDCINIQLSPTGDKAQYYYLNYEPVANSYTDAEHGFITDMLHPKFGWNDNSWDAPWEYENRLDTKAGVWTSLVTIPYTTLRTEAPSKGTLWAGNVGRVHFYSDKQQRELSYWAVDLNVSKTPGDGNFGEFIFR